MVHHMLITNLFVTMNIIFYKFNPKNDKAFIEADMIEDAQAKKEFENAVYNKFGKDKVKSLYYWFLERNYIDSDDYSNLLSIRDLRNRIIHEFDKKENLKFQM